MPQGLSTWRVETGFSYDFKSQYYSYPLLWDQALSDDWSVTWSPFPLDFRFQMIHENDRVLGIAWNLMGPAYSRSKDFLWKPSVSFYFKEKASSSYALESGLWFQPEIGGLQLNEPISWTVGYWMGALFQFSDRFALGPRFYLFFEKGNPLGAYLSSEKPRVDPSDIRLRFPVGAFASWMIFRQIELALDYRFHGLGYDGYINHQVFLNAIYYW